MRVVIQRVRHCSVSIDNKLFSEIEKGLLVLLGIEDSDTEEDIDWLCHKIINMRIFNDENGLMNKSLMDNNGNILVVSQFTLYAQTKKGNRPSFIKASKHDFAVPMYEKFCQKLGILMNKEVKTGKFGADMQVSLLNDGPVTVWIDTNNKE